MNSRLFAKLKLEREKKGQIRCHVIAIGKVKKLKGRLTRQDREQGKMMYY